jgi:hypothetical protein
MKRFNILIRAIGMLFCFYFFSCNYKKTTISDFSWLEGKWVGSTNGLNLFEVWLPAKDFTLKGIAGGHRGADTVFFETIKIEQRGADFFYVARRVNNKQPVDFKFVGYKKDSIVFENSNHDFPQRIVYFRLSDNAFYACIDGMDAGKYSRIEFPYQKSN